MRRHAGLIVLWMAFFAGSGLLFAQTTSESVGLRIGIAGSYFAPNLNELNAAYAAEEASRLLPQGEDFKSLYLGRASLSVDFAKIHSIQLEGAISYLRPSEKQTTSYLREYYAGASYLLSPFVCTVYPYIGAGGGAILFNAQRTYTDRVGISSFDYQTELHGIAGVGCTMTSRWTLLLEGRYMYAPKLKFIRPAMELNISTFSVGIGIQYGLFS